MVDQLHNPKGVRDLGRPSKKQRRWREGRSGPPGKIAPMANAMTDGEPSSSVIARTVFPTANHYAVCT